MPQRDYVLCHKDIVEIALQIFKQGGFVVPDKDYDSDQPLRIETTEQLREFLSSGDSRLFFFISPDWQTCPLLLRESSKNGRRFFFVSQKNGGPTLDVFVPSPFKSSDGKLTIAPGFVGYHPVYWNQLAARNEAVPPALLEFYRSVTKSLTDRGIKIKGRKRTFIVTKNSQECFPSINWR